MDSWTGREPLRVKPFNDCLGGTCQLNFHFLTANSTSSPGSETGADVLRHGSATYKPKGCWRYTGAALPPDGTPTPTHSLVNLNERLIRLAFGAKPEGHNAPPLETYTTSTAEHGDVYRATDEYVRWFHAQYPKAGGENRARRITSRLSSEGMGGPEVSFGLEGVNDF